MDNTKRLMPALGYEASPFNIEYFWDEDTDRLSLLEINPRISQSHGRMFRLVEGAPHHQVLIDLALGRAPRLPRGEGEFPTAGKLFLRHFGEGGVVRRVPSDDEVAKLRERFGEAEVEIEVEVGENLADLEARDSFSFELGRVHLGAEDHDELLERFEAAKAMLTFEIDEG